MMLTTYLGISDEISLLSKSPTSTGTSVLVSHKNTLIGGIAITVVGIVLLFCLLGFTINVKPVSEKKSETDEHRNDKDVSTHRQVPVMEVSQSHQGYRLIPVDRLNQQAPRNMNTMCSYV
jgi:hypothetical protein